jgi:signal peptidase II
MSAPKTRLRRVYVIMLFVAAVVFVLDAGSKNLAEAALQHEGESRDILSWFKITLVYNYGAAFGMLKNLPELLRKGVLLLLPPIVLFVLWRSYVINFKRSEVLGPTAIGLVIGGAVGNFWDRLPDGRVTDFIDWYYRSENSCLPQFFAINPGTCHWPIFNLADCAITLAMVLLVVHSFMPPKSMAGVAE